ncbi:MAG: Gfo/Idh/MocA family oxidoreductase [Pyrinomonadaceae bacterium]
MSGAAISHENAWRRLLRETGELVAVARADYQQAESFAREFGARRWYRSLSEMLVDDQVDAIYLATPVDLHAPMTLEAAAACKHVLAEKPMALDVAECESMIAACRSSSVQLGVAYYRRFYPVVRRLKELLRDGTLGQPVVVQINAFERFDPAPGDPRRWFLDAKRSGGGPVFDFGCHRVEILLYLLGPVRSVQSHLGTLLFERDVEDTGIAIIKFENGARAVLTVTHAAAEPQDTLDIYGSNGSVHVPVLNKGEMSIVTRSETVRESHPPDHNLHRPLIEDFSRAVQEEREPEVNGSVGLEVAQVIADIYRNSPSWTSAN